MGEDNEQVEDRIVFSEEKKQKTFVPVPAEASGPWPRSGALWKEKTL
jgi:hypothetical protein